MTPEEMLFECLRQQAINEDLEFYRAARDLVLANKVRNQDVWEPEEAAKTMLVLRELDKRIRERESDLEA